MSDPNELSTDLLRNLRRTLANIILSRISIFDEQRELDRIDLQGSGVSELIGRVHGFSC